MIHDKKRSSESQNAQGTDATTGQHDHSFLLLLLLSFSSLLYVRNQEKIDQADEQIISCQLLQLAHRLRKKSGLILWIR